MSNAKLNGKVAFITGGNRGLGLETARELGKQGIVVVLGSRDREKRRSRSCETSRRRHYRGKSGALMSQSRRTIRRLTITSQKNTADWIFWLTTPAFGRKATLRRPVQCQTPASAVSPEILRETFETNFFATVALTQKLLPLIRKAPAGRIVNVSSILGSLTLHADPAHQFMRSRSFAYDASKTALNAFTVHLAHELRDTQIKVNSAHPGWVKTDMGGPNATMEVSEGGKTSAQLATLADDGPSGGFFHLGQPLPW